MIIPTLNKSKGTADMLRSKNRLFNFIFTALFFSLGFGQTSTTDEILNSKAKLFIDCSFCDHDNLRAEVSFVNYVVNRQDANVFLLITREKTASNGYEYIMAFIGQNSFEGENQTLTFSTSESDSDAEIDTKIIQYLKLGLIKYSLNTTVLDNITLNYTAPGSVEKSVQKDPWNSWVFKISAHSHINAEESSSSLYSNFNMSANRVTEALKIKLYYNAHYNSSSYTYNENEYENSSQGDNMGVSVVKSINDHFSLGVYGGGSSSSYANLDRSYSFFPGIEYNFFPYSEFSRRELTVIYKLGGYYTYYIEETIYDKFEDGQLKESIGINLELHQPWGTIESSVSGSHLFSDTSINRLSIYGKIDLKIYKGLSFYVKGRYSKIHDQTNLVKANATEEDVLLQIRQLQTSYSYWTSFGFSYTFGSMFNNVVNTRYGD